MREHRRNRLPANVLAGQVGLLPFAHENDRCVDSRVGWRHHHRTVGDLERRTSEDYPAVRRDPRAKHRPELKVCPVVAHRLEPGGSCLFGDPRGGAKLINGARFAATHRLTGEHEQVSAQIFL